MGSLEAFACAYILVFVMLAKYSLVTGWILIKPSQSSHCVVVAEHHPQHILGLLNVVQTLCFKPQH